MFDVSTKAVLGQGIATIPEFIWELSLGIYLTVKGFKPSLLAFGICPRSRSKGASCRGLKDRNRYFTQGTAHRRSRTFQGRSSRHRQKQKPGISEAFFSRGDRIRRR
jgi:hypothetical protein